MSREGVVAISGVGVVGPFGAGEEAFSAAVGAGPATLFGGGPADAGASTPMFGSLRARRLDRFTQLALLAAQEAARTAGRAGPLGGDAALVLASSRGPMRAVSNFFYGACADASALGSPTLFSQTLPSGTAGMVCMALGIKGPVLTVTDAGNTLSSALLAASALLGTGRVRHALVGVVDECVEPPPPDAPEKWTFGAVPLRSEGAAFFLLDHRGEGPGRVRLEGVGAEPHALPDVTLDAAECVECGFALAAAFRLLATRSPELATPWGIPPGARRVAVLEHDGVRTAAIVLGRSRERSGQDLPAANRAEGCRLRRKRYAP